LAGVFDAVMAGLELAAGLSPDWPAPPSALAALLAMLALVVALLPASPLPRWSAVFLLWPWLWPLSTAPEPGSFHLSVFDAGQGQATAIRTRSAVVLYDAGPDWPGGNTGESLLNPWLSRQRLDLPLAFISHGDSDHAGGLPGLSPDPGEIVSGQPERVAGATPCRRGQQWQFDGVRFRVLWPPADLSLSQSNNHSCVVHIQGRHGSALLTGDIEKPVEYWLLRHEPSLRADILQVPHHGSRSSSSHGFIKAVRPEQAVVSAGFLNPFSHPAPAIRERYDKHGIPLYVSAETGMIEFRIDGQHNAAPVLWRRQFPRPWRAQAPARFVVE
jgi:competence protein ComEC